MTAALPSLILPGVLVLMAFLYVGLPALFVAAKKRSLFRLARLKDCICLTFDDGPHPDSTPRVLDLLEKSNLKATFFLVGANAERHRTLVRAIEKAGHEIGGHGYHHVHPWKASPLACLRDLILGDRAMRSLGLNGRLLRPPYGKLNLLTLLYVLLLRKKLALWTLDPKDYRQTSGARTAELILSKLAPGSVILLHDGRERPGDPLSTVEALEALLEARGPQAPVSLTIGEVLA